MVTDEKGQTKNMYMKRNQKSNHCAKNVLQCRILKASKTDVNGEKVQTTAKYVQFDAWARTGTNRCNAKTGNFVYLWYKLHFNKNGIFVAIYGIRKSKTKTCFSQNLKSKNIVSKLKNVIMR